MTQVNNHGSGGISGKMDSKCVTGGKKWNNGRKSVKFMVMGKSGRGGYFGGTVKTQVL